LFEVAESWVKIRGIVDTTYYKENPDTIKLYSEKWIEIHEINSWKLHAKSIIIDARVAYIGSINFSRYSFDENREIWIIVDNKNILEQLLKVFYSDL